MANCADMLWFMIHPNEQAENYIYEKFASAYFDKELTDFLKIWQPIKMGLNHKPQHIGTISHQRFLEELLEKLLKLNSKIDLSTEILKVKSELGIF